MREQICIYGAGAIGLDLAWNFIRAGNDVTLIARGEALSSLRAQGIIHAQFPDDRISPNSFMVTDDPTQAGVHKYVFLTTKVGGLLEVSGQVRSLINAESLVLSATNGIPPWYSYRQIETIGRFSFPNEPREEFIANINPEQLAGVVVGRSVKLLSPGILAYSAGRGFTVGEIDHSQSQRCRDLCDLVSETNISASISDNIHRDIWIKLIGNVAVSPLSVLTEKTIGEMLRDHLTKQRMVRLIRETEDVGLRLGVIRPGDFDQAKFFEFMETRLSDHRPSMFDDFKHRRPLEIGRIVDVVIMLAQAEGPGAKSEVAQLESLRDELAWKLSIPRQIPMVP